MQTVKLTACFDALRSLSPSLSDTMVQPSSELTRASALDFLRVPQDHCLTSCAHDLHWRSMMLFALTGSAVGEEPDRASGITEPEGAVKP